MSRATQCRGVRQAKPRRSLEDIPEPRLIGYFAKPTMPRPEWLKAGLVEEICSVSTCMSGLRGLWEEEGWRRNAMWVFDSPEIAFDMVPVGSRASCDLYAYRLFPVRYFKSCRQPFAIPSVKPVPVDGSFILLGYDLVSRYCDNDFECSPLSCNSLAAEVPTNRHCLLNTAEEAFALAPTLEVPGQPMRGEPGPYHIVEVWRQKK